VTPPRHSNPDKASVETTTPDCLKIVWQPVRVRASTAGGMAMKREITQKISVPALIDPSWVKMAIYEGNCGFNEPDDENFPPTD
jgi:hypothetical protein